MSKNEKIIEDLVEYMKNNKHNISYEEIRFLLGYIRKLKETKVEVDENVTPKTIVSDLKLLRNRIESGDLTKLSFERLNKVLELFERLIDEDDLDDISYEVDRLFFLNDMDVRKNSTIAQKLKITSKESKRSK